MFVYAWIWVYVLNNPLPDADTTLKGFGALKDCLTTSWEEWGICENEIGRKKRTRKCLANDNGCYCKSDNIEYVSCIMEDPAPIIHPKVIKQSKGKKTLMVSPSKTDEPILYI